MTQDIDWIEIREFKTPIGAIGFIGNKAAIVASYFDSADGNRDGNVSLLEWGVSKISPLDISKKAVTEVAMAARYNMDVLKRDASFGQEANRMFLDFASGLIEDGVYTVYFSRGVKTVGAGVARMITKNMIKQIFIRKGFEKAAKEALKRTVH